MGSSRRVKIVYRIAKRKPSIICKLSKFYSLRYMHTIQRPGARDGPTSVVVEFLQPGPA